MMKEWFIDADSVSHVSKMIKTNFQILVQLWLVKLVLQGSEAIRTCHGSIDLDDPFWIKKYFSYSFDLLKQNVPEQTNARTSKLGFCEHLAP